MDGVLSTIRANPRFERLLRLFLSFVSGQASIQIIQAFNGLILVWLLPLEEFAIYAVFTAALGFISHLLGFGIRPILISKVGVEFQNRKKIGRYMRAGSYLRMWLLWIVSPMGLVFLWFSGMKSTQGLFEMAGLSICLLFTGYLSSQIDLLGAPAQMAGKIGGLYKYQFCGEVVRAVLTGFLWFFASLDALSASIISMLGLTIAYFGIKHIGRRLFDQAKDFPRAEVSELWHFLLPGLPNAVFSAFQGQISLFVVAFFGSTQQIASVGALGRLARVMAFLNAANPMLIGPALTRMSEIAFWRRLPWILLLVLSVAAGIAFSGFLFPDLLLKLLGANYQNLGSSVWIVTLGAGLTYFVSVQVTIFSFKRWTSWWFSFGIIGVILAAQALVAKTCDLTSISGALWLGVAANAARILVMTFFTAVARFRPLWLRTELSQKKGAM